MGMDAVTESMFTNAVRDLATANKLLREALTSGRFNPPNNDPVARTIRQASENLRVVEETLKGLAKRIDNA